jgi:adenylate kinase family enzyme
MPGIVIFGNSGSGKTTMARRLAGERGLAHLDLDSLAWQSPGVRRSRKETSLAIREFLGRHDHWVVEGCYGDLLEEVVPAATELRFLNPGIDVCIANCRARPWEPEKYPSSDAQDAMLEFLLTWVREYETRTDEYSLARHRLIFDSFPGPKREFTTLPRAGRHPPELTRP